MIASLTGVLASRAEDRAVIDVGGVGFALQMSTGSLASLGEIGTTVRVETHMQVRADSITLFGFASSQERTVFERLTSVSGVGAKYALAILSAYTPGVLARIIGGSDVAGLSQVSGIGKKTAQRIILELKGNLDDLLKDLGENRAATDGYGEAIAALTSIGFSTDEATSALADYDGDLDDTGAAVKAALRRLA
ncbi:MAG: Holliday junction branch migration protein RuvA [Coriobacteriales bacterium]|jgi:Holliday junction DNA helicase RuvA|nr:Holliday junction branch migration protein RuvA [Coriobacteriales bacterium]